MKRIAHFIVDNRKIIVPFMILLTLFTAFLIPRVTVNYNLAEYLPEESQTRIGLERMEAAFGKSGTFDVMVTDTTSQEAKTIRNAIQGFDAVSLVTFDESSDNHFKDQNALLQVTIPDDTYSDTATEAIESTQDYLDNLGVDYHLGGAAYSNYSLQRTVMEEIPIILLMAVLIIMTLLTLTARSWLEPFVFLFVIAMAITMNLGTNILYGDISYITQSVAAVLQLGLSMNYSIILMNRFYQEKETQDSTGEIMKRALHKSIKPVTSSSLTTVAGMLALSFMTFQIGMDLGLVLAKGILISLFSVLVILPGMIVLFRHPLEKTQKKRFSIRGGFLSTCPLKGRTGIPVLTILLVALSLALHSTNTYTFTDTPELEGEEAIESVFGRRESVVVMVERREGTLGEERNFLDALDSEVAHIKNYQATSNTVNQPLRSEDIIMMGDIDPVMGRLLFSLYQMDEQDLGEVEVEMKTLITFLYESVQNEEYDALFDEDMKDTIIETYEVLEYFDWPQNDDYTYEELSDVSNDISADESQLLYAFYFSENDIAESLTLPAITLMEYIDRLITENTTIQAMIDPSLKDELDDAYEELLYAKGMFESDDALRIILNFDLEEEGDTTFNFVETLQDKAATHFESEVYFTGMIITNYDLEATFDEDLIKISVVTISAIILLVALTFRALVLPFILVIIIQGAIWMSMSVHAVMNNPLHFMGYIVVTAIQMGATVDYGILIASNYLENRQDKSKTKAIETSLDQSIMTVFTSALILITAGLSVGIFSSHKVIYSMGNLIARGAFISGLFVLFLLPGVLFTLDKILMKTTYKAGRKNGK